MNGVTEKQFCANAT